MIETDIRDTMLNMSRDPSLAGWYREQCKQAADELEQAQEALKDVLRLSEVVKTRLAQDVAAAAMRGLPETTKGERKCIECGGPIKEPGVGLSYCSEGCAKADADRLLS